MDQESTDIPAKKSLPMPVISIAVLILLVVAAIYLLSQQPKTKTSSPVLTSVPTSEPLAIQQLTPSVTLQIGETKPFTVSAKNFSFSPNNIKVKMGNIVKITFLNTGGVHDFVIDEFNVRTKQINTEESEEVEFVADKVGTFEYYCSVGQHRKMGMVGTLTVE